VEAGDPSTDLKKEDGPVDTDRLYGGIGRLKVELDWEPIAKLHGAGIFRSAGITKERKRVGIASERLVK
jgi:hypothetical protein